MTDVKPATDAEIDAIRAGLPSTAFLFSPAHQVMMLIARIDAERAARERAEARVKELKEALGFAASVIKSGESWTDTCEQVIAAALKEPSNG